MANLSFVLLAIFAVWCVCVSAGVEKNAQPEDSELLRTYVTIYGQSPNPGNLIVACKSGDDNIAELLLTNGGSDFRSFSFTGNSWTHFWCESKMTDSDFNLYIMHTPIFNQGGPNHGGAWLFNQTGSGMLHEGWTYRKDWEAV